MFSAIFITRVIFYVLIDRYSTGISFG